MDQSVLDLVALLLGDYGDPDSKQLAKSGGRLFLGFQPFQESLCTFFFEKRLCGLLVFFVGAVVALKD